MTNSCPQAPRPTALAIRSDSIPLELRELRSWVGWRYELRGKKWTKVPICAATGQHASTAESRTWASYEEALQSVERFTLDGVGIVLGDGIVGVDLDHAFDSSTGELEPWARDIVEQLGSYAELSVSGTGLHVLARGELPPGPRRKGRVEMYSSDRYFTVTGHRLPASPTILEERTGQLADVHRMHLAQAAPCAKAEHSDASPRASTGGAHTAAVDNAGTLCRSALSDDEIIKVACQASNGEKVRALFNGEIDCYASQSEADLALCRYLAFYTGNDPQRLERLFGRSALAVRDKWHKRADYRQATVTTAIDSCKGVFYTGKTLERGPRSPEHTFEVVPGIRFTVESIVEGRRWTTARGVVDFEGGRIDFSFNSTPTAIDKAARIILGLQAGSDLPRINTGLRKILQEMKDIAAASPKCVDSQAPRSILQRQADELRLSFRDEKDRLWSEKLGTFMYCSQFCDRMATTDLVDSILRSGECEKRTAAISAARKLAEEVFAETIRRTPARIDCALGPESESAIDLRAALLRLLSFATVFDASGRSQSLVSALHSLWLEKKHLWGSKPLNPGAQQSRARSTWYRVEERSLWLRFVDDASVALGCRAEVALRFELFGQTKTQPPVGIRCHAELARLARAYGLALEEQADHRHGHERARLLVLSPQLVEEAVASWPDLLDWVTGTQSTEA